MLLDDVGLRHVGQRGRHREPLRERRIAHELRELVRQQIQLDRHEVQLRSRREAAVDVEGREIEVERRVAGAAVRRLDVEVRLRPLDEGDHVRVRDHHALRHPGRARREQDVRHVRGAVRARHGGGGARLEVGERRVRGQAQRRLAVEPGDPHRPEAILAHELLDQRRGLAAGEQHAALERGEDLRHARRGVLEVHGRVRAVGLERADHRRDRERRLRQQQRDAVAALRAEAGQQPRQAIGALLERAVGELLALPRDRRGLRAERSLRAHVVLEQLQDWFIRAEPCRMARVTCSSSSVPIGTSRMMVLQPFSK